MLSFVQNWFGPRSNPIGIDFGSDSLRLAQVQFDGRDYKLLAAACCDVPTHAQTDPESRFDFFTEAVRDLLVQGKFKGRNVVLSLPAAMMHVHHFRLPKMDDSQIKKTLRTEARSALPIDPARALMRHLVAGEVRQHHETKLEVILIAAARDTINQYLKAASLAKLNVMGMKMEPVALVDCFSHVHRRKIDSEVVSLYVDLGASGTRVTIALGTQILFARSIPIGGDQFNAAVAEAMNVSLDDARLLRLKLASVEASHTEGRDKRNLTAPQEAEVQPEPHTSQLEVACGLMTARLTEALQDCVRQHQATFPHQPVARIIFVGGEARHRPVCTQIAREMGLAAQVGDPTVRMARASDIPIETGIDRRLPQPAWSVAIGLSFDSPRPLESTAASIDESPQTRAGAA